MSNQDVLIKRPGKLCRKPVNTFTNLVALPIATQPQPPPQQTTTNTDRLLMKICPGDRVILCRGVGKKKRKLNGRLATVVNVPPRGSWMSVSIAVVPWCDRTDTSSGTSEPVVVGRTAHGPIITKEVVIHWRKGSCRLEAVAHRVLEQGVVQEPQPQPQQAETGKFRDPFTDLLPGTALIPHILSYLLDGRNDQGHVWVQCAARLHTQLSLVSPQFRDISLYGPLNVDLDILPDRGYVIPCLLWLYRTRPVVGALKLHSRDGGARMVDIPLLQRLLEQCDTRHLSTVQIRFQDIGSRIEQPAHYILPTEMQSTWLQSGYYFGRIMSLLDEDEEPALTCCDIARHFGIPHPEDHSNKPRYHDLQGTLASHCPQLSHLSVHFPVATSSFQSMPDGLQSNLSLFSMRSITKLHLSIVIVVTDGPLERRRNPLLISDAIASLPHLQVLQLSGGQTFFSYYRHVHVISPTLRILHVLNMRKQVLISCDCPQLQVYRGMEYPWGSGSTPLVQPDPADRYELHRHDPIRELLGWRDDLQFYVAGTVPFVGLTVPDTCKIIDAGFRFPRGNADYEDYVHEYRQSRMGNVS
jgi:hypothetical protein